MKRVVLYAIPVLLGALSVMWRTTPYAAVPIAQQEPIVEQPNADDVSDEQLKTFIDVYSSMQLDHSLTLEEALKPHDVSMEEFRSIERRVQGKSRLVAKVRAALLEQATQRSAFSEPRAATTTSSSGGKKP